MHHQVFFRISLAKPKEKKTKLDQQEVETSPTKAQTLSQRKRVRRTRNTIVKNPAAINAKLQTNACVDPFFSKINSLVGGMEKADRMIMNILPNTNSFLHPTTKHWSSRGYKGFNGEVNCMDSQLIRVHFSRDIRHFTVQPKFDFEGIGYDENTK
jgi:Condensin complex subunit 2